jgi:membrane protease YdiL (CAAX protease family)
MAKKANSIWAILVLYLLVALVWTFYRAFFHFPEPIDELIFKPLIFLVPIFFWVKFKEKNKFLSLGFTKSNFLKNILIGFGLGLVFALEGVIISAIKYRGLTFNPDHLKLGNIFFMGSVSLTTGFSEEVLNRGFLMNRLWKKWGSEFWANFISGLFFALMHLPIAFLVFNYRISVDLIVYCLSIFVLGFADGFIFGRTGSVYSPIISHALWNWSVVLFK